LAGQSFRQTRKENLKTPDALTRQAHQESSGNARRRTAGAGKKELREAGNIRRDSPFHATFQDAQFASFAATRLFFPEPLSIARTRKAFLAEIGLIGVFPLDSQGAQSPSSSIAAAIFRTNCELIDSCPGVLANLMLTQSVIALSGAFEEAAPKVETSS
jgi:hypothetical protein